MLHWLGSKASKAGLCGSLQGPGKGSIPITRSRQSRKAPSSLTGLFRFLCLASLSSSTQARKDAGIKVSQRTNRLLFSRMPLDALTKTYLHPPVASRK